MFGGGWWSRSLNILGTSNSPTGCWLFSLPNDPVTGRRDAGVLPGVCRRAVGIAGLGLVAALQAEGQQA